MGLVPASAELTMFYHEFTASLALAAQAERERIIKLLEDLASEFTRKEELERYVAVAVKRINESR